MLKSALLTLAHLTEGEAPLLNTICLWCGAAKSQGCWRGWGSEAPEERGTGEEQGQALPPQNRGRERSREAADGASAPSAWGGARFQELVQADCTPRNPNDQNVLSRLKGCLSWKGQVGDGHEGKGHLSAARLQWDWHSPPCLLTPPAAL